MEQPTTRIISESDITVLSRELTCLNHPQAYAAWPAFFYGLCNQPVPVGDYADVDDEMFFGVYDNYLLAFTSDFDYSTTIYQWTGAAWTLWVTGAGVDDEDLPEDADPDAIYYRVPAE